MGSFHHLIQLCQVFETFGTTLCLEKEARFLYGHEVGALSTLFKATRQHLPLILWDHPKNYALPCVSFRLWYYNYNWNHAYIVCNFYIYIIFLKWWSFNRFLHSLPIQRFSRRPRCQPPQSRESRWHGDGFIQSQPVVLAGEDDMHICKSICIYHYECKYICFLMTQFIYIYICLCTIYACIGKPFQSEAILSLFEEFRYSMTQFQESGGEKERLMADLNGYVREGFQLRGFRQIEPYNRGVGGAIIVFHNERLEFAILLSFCCLKRHEGEVLSNLQPLVYSISLRFSILVRGTRKRLMKWGLGWRLDEKTKCGKVSNFYLTDDAMILFRFIWTTS